MSKGREEEFIIDLIRRSAIQAGPDKTLERAVFETIPEEAEVRYYPSSFMGAFQGFKKKTTERQIACGMVSGRN